MESSCLQDQGPDRLLVKSLVVGDVVHPPVEAVTVDVDVVSLDHSGPGIAGLVFLRVLVDVSISVVANFIL